MYRLRYHPLCLRWSTTYLSENRPKSTSNHLIKTVKTLDITTFLMLFVLFTRLPQLTADFTLAFYIIYAISTISPQFSWDSLSINAYETLAQFLYNFISPINTSYTAVFTCFLLDHRYDSELQPKHYIFRPQGIL